MYYAAKSHQQGIMIIDDESVHPDTAETQPWSAEAPNMVFETEEPSLPDKSQEEPSLPDESQVRHS